MTTAQQLVMGVFRDHAQAEQAINELLQAGFDHHQIRFAGRGISTGGMLEKIKSLFTGQDISSGGIYDDLVREFGLEVIDATADINQQQQQVRQLVADTLGLVKGERHARRG